MKKDITLYADDDTESIWVLLKLRIPPLLVGLFLGVVLSFITSQFEEVIATNVSIAFFIPFIVYIADAVGAQTQNIYIRDLKSGKTHFKKYLVKEGFLGIILGFLIGLVVAFIIFIWFNSLQLAFAIGLSIFVNILLAPVIALLITEIFKLEHRDPAVGSGPIGAIIQDTISIVVYGLITSAIIL